MISNVAWRCSWMGAEGLAGLLKVARGRSFKEDRRLVELAMSFKTREDGRKPEGAMGGSRHLGISSKPNSTWACSKSAGHDRC
jgi:hypothetical protein